MFQKYISIQLFLNNISFLQSNSILNILQQLLKMLSISAVLYYRNLPRYLQTSPFRQRRKRPWSLQ